MQSLSRLHTASTLAAPCASRAPLLKPLACHRAPRHTLVPPPQFQRSWPLFDLRPDAVPQLEDLSQVLQGTTGFRIRPVAGLVSPPSGAFRDFTPLASMRCCARGTSLLPCVPAWMVACPTLCISPPSRPHLPAAPPP